MMKKVVIPKARFNAFIFATRGGISVTVVRKQPLIREKPEGLDQPSKGFASSNTK